MDSPQIRFYHLTRRSVAEVLPALLFKALEAGHRAVVRHGAGADSGALSRALWVAQPASFLAHGCAPAQGADPHAADHPIWLTPGAENPNGADVLFLLPGANAGESGGYALVCHLFESADGAALDAARASWRAAKGAGADPAYWQETEAGSWEQRA